MCPSFGFLTFLVFGGLFFFSFGFFCVSGFLSLGQDPAFSPNSGNYIHSHIPTQLFFVSKFFVLVQSSFEQKSELFPRLSVDHYFCCLSENSSVLLSL